MFLLCPPGPPPSVRYQKCMRLACAALSLSLGLVHFQRTATHAAAGDRSRGFISLTCIGHFHEGEASGPTGFLIGHDIDTFHNSVGFEQGSQFLLSRAEREIANVKVLHNISSLMPCWSGNE